MDDEIRALLEGSGHHLVIDVEAAGQTPVLYPMIQIGMFDLMGNSIMRRMRPRPGDLIDEGALKSIKVTREEIAGWPDPEQMTHEVMDWIKTTYNGERVYVWSDNPAFDWQFLNGYLWLFCGDNPLGHSARRIGDLFAGMSGNFRNHSGFKKYRKTEHIHDALDDAKGNAEALIEIIKRMNAKRVKK